MGPSAPSAYPPQITLQLGNALFCPRPAIDVLTRVAPEGSRRMARIMTIGEILVEIMATARGQSFRAPGTLVGPFSSSAPAIFIDQVGRLGRPAGIIGCVGDDDFGWLNIERLRRDGVDTSAITMLADAVTGSAFVTYTETGERHFIFNIANSASGSLSASSITEPMLADCTWFHVMGSSLFSP